MKTKAAKQPKKAKATVQVKDLKPKKNPRAGYGRILMGTEGG